MKKTILLFMFLAGTVGVSAQNVTEKFEGTVNGTGTYKIQDVKYDAGTKEVTVYAIDWKKSLLEFEKSGSEEKKKGFQVVSGSEAASLMGTNATVPHLSIYNLKAGGAEKVAYQPIHLSAYFPDDINADANYTVLDAGSRQKTSTSADAISKKQVETTYGLSLSAKSMDDGESYYMDAAPRGFAGIIATETTIPYTYNQFKNTYENGEPSVRTINFDLASDSKVFLDPFAIPDNKEKKVIIPASVATGDRISTFMSKAIYTVDSEGKATKVDFTLDYPKTLIFAKGFGSADDTISSFTNGAILIYGRASGVGKKKNDPDETRYYVVILDKTGAIKHQGWFNYGTEKRSLMPFSAYRNANNEIVVFGKGIGSDSPGYATLIFNESGLKTVHDYDHAALGEKGAGRKEEGLTTFFSRRFKPVSTVQLSNGNVVISGEAYEKESKTLPPAENQSFGQTVYFNIYRSHVFLLFSPEGELLKHFTSVRPQSESMEALQMLLQSDQHLTYQVKGSGNSSVINLNLAGGSISKVDPQELGISNAFLKLDEESNSLVIAGKASDAKSTTLKCAVVKLN